MSGGVHVSTDELVKLETQARDLSFVQKGRSQRQLAGRMRSSMRGRGLTFEELRDYLPGDDIRSIDWRVTARTTRPFVRVYSEEKERPAIIIVDQRINMFFGSRLSMKSVTAAQAAMLCAWRILGSGDRVGGFVIGDSDTDEVKPHRSRSAVVAFAERIARMNAALNASASIPQNSNQLDTVLESVSNVAHHDHLVLVISDFDGHTPRTRDLLVRLSSRNDVICLLVYDPFLLELPTFGEVVASGGGSQAQLAFATEHVRSSIETISRDRGRELLAWQNALGIPMLPISAAKETAPQLRRLLEQSAWQQRRR